MRLLRSTSPDMICFIKDSVLRLCFTIICVAALRWTLRKPGEKKKQSMKRRLGDIVLHCRRDVYVLGLLDARSIRCKLYLRHHWDMRGTRAISPPQ